MICIYTHTHTRTDEHGVCMCERVHARTHAPKK